MDQVKEYLQVALKYRFWILMAIAALLPVIAYFVSAGDLAAQPVRPVGHHDRVEPVVGQAVMPRSYGQRRYSTGITLAGRTGR